MPLREAANVNVGKPANAHDAPASCVTAMASPTTTHSCGLGQEMAPPRPTEAGTAPEPGPDDGVELVVAPAEPHAGAAITSRSAVTPSADETRPTSP
jgi:hypothetical protein